MNLNQFLSHVHKDPTWLSTYPVVCFKGDEHYPLLFFSLLCSRLKETGLIMLEPVDVTQQTATLLGKFQTSFLGMPTLYWLKNLSELDEKKRGYWTTYLQEYAGPNTIGFFTTDALPSFNNQHLMVMLTHAIDQKTFVDITNFFCKPGVIPTSSIARIFKGRDILPFEAACLVMHYLQVVGSGVDIFIAQWLDKILVPERSLFTLSTHFFAKKGHAFFELWSRIKDDYPHVFWVSFWSEQLWRAHYFVQLAQGKQFDQAKKIGVRLPFSFMQRDWKLHSPQQLRMAHDMIYAIDSSIKNGGREDVLDLFYSKFFVLK